MSSTGKKTRKKPSQVLAPKPKLTPNPSLPDDLLLSCFARVSRLNYPTLSFVSKSFRSLIASPELYKTRTLLGRTESCLYVYLQLSPGSNPRWFTLCRKPYQSVTNHTSKKKKNSSGYVLATLPIPDSPLAHSSGLVALGSSIYSIGRSSVSILDCRTHTWHEAPSMRVERDYAMANVVNGKIYVAGGCKDCDSSNWMEVFDPKTQTWEPVFSPLVERSGCQITKSAVIEGKMYMLGLLNGVAYKPKEDRWEAVSGIDHLVLGRRRNCVIDSVLYVYDDIVGIKWLDFNFKTAYWLMLKGLCNFPKYGCLKMVNYGGKLAVFWDVYEPSKGKMIWCAVIALERRNRIEIWGNVEWFNDVLTVPVNYQFVSALTATV